MTKKEREMIKKAIRLIHNSNEYFEGMNILAELVEWPKIKFPETVMSIDACLTAAKEYQDKDNEEQ